MKKKILIISGGISKEREISLETGFQVASELIQDNFEVKICEPNFQLSKIIKKFKPKIIFNALHGQFGEDGYIQTILETLNIPYTHSGVLASAKAMDKLVSKKIFLKNKILTPKYIEYCYDKNKIELINIIQKKLKFPVVVKPMNEGSSVNVFICTKGNIYKNLEKIKFYKKVLIEEFIPGREIQVAIMGNKKLGTIELKPKRKFYDYDAKYNPQAKTEHIIPVKLSKKDIIKVEEMALKAHKVIGCMGVTRSDFKFYKNKFYLLEINTQPGMTKLSLVPEIASYNGISFIQLLKWILNNASKKNKKIFIYLFFFVFLGTINNHKLFNSNAFKIKNFQILGLENNYIEEFENDLLNITKLNILFVNKDYLKSILNSNSLIETFQVFKVYPSTLNIKIEKTNFLARLNINGDIFLIGSNGKLTKDFLLSDSEILPFIFGNPKVEEFLKIFSIINTSDLKYENVKNLFFYKSGRIDLELKDNILIKLPLDNLENIFKKISQLISNNKFNSKIIDARVSNQIILYD